MNEVGTLSTSDVPDMRIIGAKREVHRRTAPKIDDSISLPAAKCLTQCEIVAIKSRQCIRDRADKTVANVIARVTIVELQMSLPHCRTAVVGAVSLIERVRPCIAEVCAETMNQALTQYRCQAVISRGSVVFDLTDLTN